MPKKWTREEEILALKLYCELPFGKLHTSTKEVKNLAVMLAKYILFENMIRPEAGSDVSRITEYIKHPRSPYMPIVKP